MSEDTQILGNEQNVACLKHDSFCEQNSKVCVFFEVGGSVAIREKQYRITHIEDSNADKNQSCTACRGQNASGFHLIQQNWLLRILGPRP
jgi:hypothetical protein